jgi:hypothetical protein
MLHTLVPLAGGSPHNGLQIIHFVRRTLQDASHFIHFLQPFPHRTLRAVFTFHIPIDILLNIKQYSNTVFYKYHQVLKDKEYSS